MSNPVPGQDYNLTALAATLYMTLKEQISEGPNEDALYTIGEIHNLWEALTGLTGAEAAELMVDLAQATTPVYAHVGPF